MSDKPITNEKYLPALEEVLRLMKNNPNLVMGSACDHLITLDDPTSTIGVAGTYFINAMVKKVEEIKIIIHSTGFDHLSKTKPLIIKLAEVSEQIDGSKIEVLSQSVKQWDVEDPIRVERLTGLCSTAMREWLIQYKNATQIIPHKSQGVCYFSIKVTDSKVRFEVEDA